MEDNGDNSLSYSDNLYEQFIEDEKILKFIKHSIPDNLYNEINNTLKSLSSTYNYRIRDKHILYVDDIKEEIKKGMKITKSSGTMSIQLKEDKYFTFDYK